jgi:hypothetical protein
VKYVAGADKDLVLASAYLPYDSPNPPPSEELEWLERFCGYLNLQIIIGVDANTHHIVWGSSNTKSRDETLLEFIISRKLEVLNRDREPTFITQRQKVVIDINLGSPYISKLGSVSDDSFHLDHRYICLEINKVDKPTVMYRNPRKTNYV